jgi:hypothetical protein
MNLTEVNSSNINKVGYDDNNLLVEYKSGVLYKYLNVPKKLYEELLNSESKGRFMNSNIKGNFEYSKIERIPKI